MYGTKRLKDCVSLSQLELIFTYNLKRQDYVILHQIILVGRSRVVYFIRPVGLWVKGNDVIIKYDLKKDGGLFTG